METPSFCVVTGGAGFLGVHLVKLLAGARPGPARRGTVPYFGRVRVADTRAFSAARAREEQGVPFSEAEAARVEAAVVDVRDAAAVREACRGAAAVFHMAAVVDVRLRPGPALCEVNVGGTRNVVRACLDERVPVLVHTSSEDVVLCDRPRRFADESTPYSARPPNAYCASKIESEREALAASDGRRLWACAVRPLHVYGPGDAHALVRTVRAVRAGRVPFRLGRGDARFGIVYAGNAALVHALAAAALMDPAARDEAAGQAFFAGEPGEGRQPNYFDFCAPYLEAKGLRAPRLYLPAWLLLAAAFLLGLLHSAACAAGLGALVPEPPVTRFLCRVLCADFYFSSAKAERVLRYRAAVGWDEGVRRTVEWMGTQDC